MMVVKKITLVTLLITVGGLTTYWVVSIVNCEILTLKHKEEFIGLELQTNMLIPAKIIKVLNYSDRIAIVYYKDEYGGDILEFRKENNMWLNNRWITIWSKQGSADGFMWPYLR